MDENVILKVLAMWTLFSSCFASSLKFPPVVPALFVIGDSSVDCGTNNFLGTFARANHLPYGRDFDTHQPTGRFSNGRIPVDYLATRLGLPLVPSYLGQAGDVQDMIHGVNYASAGAGIIFSSGSELGQHISFAQQVQQFTDTLQQFIISMGEDAATELISDSVFYISIGINDYIHYYLLNVSNVDNLYLPWSFNQFLASSVRQEIKNLYNLNVRKVVLTGLAPIGCAPQYLWQYGSMDILKNHESYGFNVTNEACCGYGKYKGWIMCLSPEMACSNASNHIWWDQFHPTDAVNAILADNIWNGQHTKMCHPMNLEDMHKSKATHPLIVRGPLSALYASENINDTRTEVILRIAMQTKRRLTPNTASSLISRFA
ncbi:hypothetical protein PIB30_001844 [Stylosanthes scabra]|uniref:Uncharacterized protein n=1 Tax=Stylosanthes scabra TaxID=79078 RepID=A0ABU6W0Z8_9FABA|nr:hypothetical protein [Stylosanthes scabra]